jgi:protein translocase SecG subunit
MNMSVFQLLAVSFVMSVAAVLFLICSVVLILIILIQKGKGGGLGAAFGGGLASGILGSKTGDFLTWVTISLVSVFLILAVVMAKFYKPTISDFGPSQVRQEEPISPRQLPPAEDTGAVTGSNVPDINLLDDQNDL